MRKGTLIGTCDVEITFDVTNMLPNNVSESKVKEIIDSIFETLEHCKNYTLCNEESELILDECTGVMCGSYEFEGTWYKYAATHDEPVDSGEEYNTLDFFNSTNLIHEMKEIYPQLNIDIHEDSSPSIKYN